jgi:predicted component of type VI protein secretion system
MATSNNSSLQLVMQRGPTPGYVYPLADAIVTLGRSGDNTIVIGVPQVSRHHARLIWQAGGWVVEDLGSANGTFVNQQRITNPKWLGPGDVLRLGDTIIFAVQFSPGAEPTLVSRRPPAQVPRGAGQAPTQCDVAASSQRQPRGPGRTGPNHGHSPRPGAYRPGGIVGRWPTGCRPSQRPARRHQSLSLVHCLDSHHP